MIEAILSNKASRNISSTQIYWRELFKSSEDSLTSTIFGLMSYLPHNIFWEILIKACYKVEGQLVPSKILSIEYWPNWKFHSNDSKVNVEPDVFIRTENYDLIIEAKRYDDNQQKVGQWENELKAYLNSYEDENKVVFLLALGGIKNKTTETIIVNEKKHTIFKCKWGRLLREIKKIIVASHVNSKELLGIASILHDLIKAFRIHGYMVGEYFFETHFGNLSNISDHSLLFFGFMNQLKNSKKYVFKSIEISSCSIDFFKKIYG